jgi:transcriptional regulator with XRE-family HTH domain
MVNVSDNHYYQVENGKRAMSLDLAIVFCERFDIRADWLLFGKGEVRNGDEKADLGGRRFKLTPALQELHEIADKIKEEEQRESETNS